jgi:threonine dehydrogenase-like Zn-dependent dehydrogenase
MPTLTGALSYPLQYGYSVVGKVIEVGSSVEPNWKDRVVFAFQPHTSHFITDPETLLLLPEGLNPEEAIYLPNMETAVNLVMDGRPLIGERVLVLGQGVVGLLTTALLSQFPLTSLITLDRHKLRRQASLELGAQASLAPDEADILQQIHTALPDGADLTYELTGSPTSLNQAIAVTGYAGRVVIGSWYGQKNAVLDLGGRFHRSRIRLVSSQVSTIAPEFSGRWTKTRRFEMAWEMLKSVKPSRFITHRLPITQAPEAYQLIDQRPEETIQVLLTYD